MCSALAALLKNLQIVGLNLLDWTGRHESFYVGMLLEALSSNSVLYVHLSVHLLRKGDKSLLQVLIP